MTNHNPTPEQMRKVATMIRRGTFKPQHVATFLEEIALKVERLEAAIEVARWEEWDEGFSYRACGGARQDNPHTKPADAEVKS